MKKIKITSLTAAALATAVLATTNLNNHTVKADTANDQVATKGQSAKEVAQTNVDNAKKDVQNAQSNVDQAQNNLTATQSQVTDADSKYKAQSEAVSTAQKEVNTKSTAVSDAQSKATSAASLVSEAKDPSKVKAANDAISAAQGEVKKAHDEKQAADDKVTAKNKDIEAKSSAVTEAQKAVDSASTAKTKADKAVTKAENALKDTGITGAQSALETATTKLNNDTAALNQAKTDQKNQQVAYDKAKAAQSDATAKFNKATTEKTKANDTYNDLNKKYQAQKNTPQDPVLVELQNKLRILQNDADASITVSDISKYKKAWQDWKDNKFDEEDREYIEVEIARNSYKADENDNEELDLNNLTDDQLREMSTFGVNLANKLRNELGVEAPALKVSEGAIKFEKEMNAQRQADYDSGKWTPDWHDVEALSNVATKLGLSSAPGETGGALNLFSQKMTMGEAKKRIYSTLTQMIFASGGRGLTHPGETPHPEFGHAGTILEATLDHGYFVSMSYATAKNMLQMELNIDTLRFQTVKEAKNKIDSGEKITGHLNGTGSLMGAYNFNWPQDINKAYNFFESTISTIQNDIALLDKGGEESRKVVEDLEKNVSKGENYFSTSVTRFGVAQHAYSGSIINANSSQFSTKEVPTLDEQIASLQSQIKAEEKNNVDTPLITQAQVDAAKAALDKAETAEKGAKDKSTSAGTTYTNAKNDLENTSKKVSSLEKEIENDKKTQGKAQAHYNELTKSNKELAEKLETAQATQQTAQSNLTTAQHKKEDADEALRTANSDLATLQGKVTEAQTNVDNKEKVLKAAQQHVNDLKNADSIKSAADSDLQAAKNALTQANKALDTEKAKLPALEQAKKTADDAVAAAQADVDTANAQLKAAQDKLTDAQSKLDKLNAVNRATKNTSKNKSSNTSKKPATKTITLSKSVPVVDKNGNPVTTPKTISKGKQTTSVKPTTITIKGKKYVKVGKNEYVPATAVKHIDSKNKTVELKKTATVVDKNGKTIKAPVVSKNLSAKNTFTLSKNTPVTINGKKYYEISKNQYVPAAAVKGKITTKKNLSLKLTHTAFVYDKHGKVVKNNLKIKFIKRGKTIKPIKSEVVTIKGKKYYQVAKNKFVKVANTKIKTISIKVKASIKGKKNIEAIDASGKKTGKIIKFHKTYEFNEKRSINGGIAYKIVSTNDWVLASKLSIKK